MACNANNIIENIDSIAVSDSFTCDTLQASKLVMDFSSLKVITQNVRSISANFQSFDLFLSRLNIDLDFIILTECWLQNEPLIPSIHGFSCFTSSHPANQNDGVIVYCNTSLTGISVTEPNVAEASCLQIQINTDTVILAIYRPCAFKNPTTFIQSLHAVIVTLRNYRNILVIGDININILDIDDQGLDTHSENYLNSMAFNGLLPAHTLPTRGPACLDHAFLRTVHRAKTIVVNSLVTDHDAVLVSIGTKLDKPPPQIINKINYKLLTITMEKIDFTSVHNSSDPNVATDLLIKILQSAIAANTVSFVPSRRKKTLKPWITQGLLRSIRNRDQMHKRLKLNPNNEILKTTFKRYRNFCNSLIKKVKSNYDRELLRSAGNNNKKLWTAIRDVTNMSKNRSNAHDLLRCKPTAEQSLNHVNSFFANVGKSLAEQILKETPDVEPHPKSPALNHTSSIRSSFTSFALLKTNMDEVHSIIDSLKSECAVGWDNISSAFVKRYKNILVPVITHICNLSLEAGIFPSAFKKALLHPIHKSGPKNCPNNYRPISILPTFSKILERILNNRLINYLESSSLLSPGQYGFRAKRSAADAVHELTDHIVKTLDNGDKCLSVFLDLAKAFDTVSIPILIDKLQRLGVRGEQLTLFHSYLTDRSQRLVINGVESSDVPVECGVPQGSILGPTLFLVYINELSSLVIPNCKIISYADDTALIFNANSFPEVYRRAQSGLDTVLSWLRANQLSINVDKTQYMPMSKIRIPSVALRDLHLVAHTHAYDTVGCSCPHLNLASSVKYLGVIVDTRLTFQPHINSTACRLRKLMHIFRKLRQVADPFLIKNTYRALCESVLSYCIGSWGGASKSVLITLERAQRAVLKVCTFKPIMFPTYDLYQYCEVLTVRQLFIIQSILKQHSYIDTSIKSRSRHLVVPTSHCKSSFAHRFFYFLGPHLYKKLHKKCNIIHLTRFKCKKVLFCFLNTLNYDETEDLLRTCT